MRVWPWSEFSNLRRELRAVKLSCSARAKKINSLTERIRVLDAALRKRKAQAHRDQLYIDALEARLDSVVIAVIRREMQEKQPLGKDTR